MNSPCLREHCSKRKAETSHKQPSSGRAYIRKSANAAETTIKSKKYYTEVCQHAANYDQIVQMRAGHFDVPIESNKLLLTIYKMNSV